MIGLLWITFSLVSLFEYFPQCRELTFFEQLVVILIFFVGGPIFAMNQVLTQLLDLFLPEGWDDDDDQKPFTRY